MPFQAATGLFVYIFFLCCKWSLSSKQKQEMAFSLPKNVKANLENCRLFKIIKAFLGGLSPFQTKTWKAWPCSLFWYFCTMMARKNDYIIIFLVTFFASSSPSLLASTLHLRLTSFLQRLSVMRSFSFWMIYGAWLALIGKLWGIIFKTTKPL